MLTHTSRTRKGSSTGEEREGEERRGGRRDPRESPQIPSPLTELSPPTRQQGETKIQVSSPVTPGPGNPDPGHSGDRVNLPAPPSVRHVCQNDTGPQEARCQTLEWLGETDDEWLFHGMQGDTVRHLAIAKDQFPWPVDRVHVMIVAQPRP